MRMPEYEVWDDSSSDISDAPLDFDPPMIANSPSSRGQALAKWILRFLMVMQAKYRTLLLTTSFAFLLAILLKWLCVCIYRIPCIKPRNRLGFFYSHDVLYARSVQRYTHTPKVTGTISKSKHCSFCRFPSHPHRSMRLPCQTLLLKTVELASKRTYLYPFVTYCYLILVWKIHLKICLKGYTDCEKWRSRSSTRTMRDVHDGEMWRNFLHYITKVSRFFLNLETWD